ncbi:Ig-like domain-containing protein [Agaribacterium sp. ZY112]|uniref:Ig-like domain-containing protein n=1 Tax=Agaribacterium sp. ZY112 TaxID=3233574 RepID=UPI0035264A6B
MFKKNPKALLSGFIGAVVAGGVSTSAVAAVQVDINADVKHSVNGANQFGRERRITIHASPIENEWIGEKEKLDYVMELGVHFGRDAGTPMWYFSQTEGDPEQPPEADDYFPWGHLDEFSRESLNSNVDGYHWALQNKYEDAQEYFDRTEYMVMASQPRPAMPNWSAYSWFGAALDSEHPWRPRTMEQAAKWYAAWLEEAYLRDTGDDPKLPMPAYWEVVNEPDMLMNTTGHEGHVSTWEELFRYHNVVADVIRETLGDKAPKVGGMTWGLHDFHKGDTTATGSPRLQNDALLTAFYGADTADNQALKDRIRNEIFAPSETMNDSDTRRAWYQWDVVWKGFLDSAGENMDFYSIHTYDWVGWPERTPTTRSGTHTEAVMDLLEWYDDKMVPGPKKEVIVSEFGGINSEHMDTGENVDLFRAKWEKIKAFQSMQMQFLERPDYITMSLPFIVVKGSWGDRGKTEPYAQSLLQRDYSTCEETDAAFINCKWDFNAAIHWFEQWRDIEGTRIDTYSSDIDIQVDAYVNNNDQNGEHHLYVIVNSMHAEDTDIDLSWAGISGNSIKSIETRHLYLDANVDGDGNAANGKGKPILAEAELASLPESLVVAENSTIVIDIEYTSAINPAFNNNETKYAGEPLSNTSPYRVDMGGSVVNTEVNGVAKPTNGEAQLRITGNMFIGHWTEANLHRSYLKVNGHDVEIDIDVRGEGQTGNVLATFEFPFPAEYLADNGNNNIEFSLIPPGELASVSIQVWDFDKNITRSTPATDSVAVTDFNVAENSIDLKVTKSQALTANFSPANASNKLVTWTSTNPNVASVDPNGVVTGTNVGSTTITAVSKDGSISDEITVSVSQLVASSVAIVGVPSTLYVGSEKQLSAAVRPIHAPDRTVTWTATPESIATVDSNGVVTAHAEGSVTIAAKTSNGISASVRINTELLMPEALSLLPETTLMPNGDSLPVQVSISPSNASLTEIEWTSSNENVASVVGDDIVATAQGTTTITGTIKGTQISDTVAVEVVDPQGEMQWREAETFDETGGAAGGFELTEEGDQINYNQTGDWAEYVWNFEHAGIYQFAMIYGTNQDNAGIEVLVDGVSNGAAALANTSDWDSRTEVVVSNAINISSTGAHTIRIKSVGLADAWQWNADKVGLRLLKASACAPNCPSPSPSPSLPASPSPSPSPSASPSPSPSPSMMVSPSPSPSPAVSPSPSPSPSVSPSSEPSPSPSVGLPGNDVVVELESFSDTGKDGAAINYDSVVGFGQTASGINYNTTGDWAEYSVSFAEAGTYNIIVNAGSPMTGQLGVALSLNGAEIASSTLAATSAWDNYQQNVVARDVSIAAGTYTLRVQSWGSSSWQWNADNVVFESVTVTQPSPSPSPSASPSPEPSPSMSPGTGGGESVMVEGESFVATGGTQGGFTTRTFWGTTTFADHVLTGAWADYTVNFAESGTYDLSFVASTKEQSDSNAKIYIDGVEVAETPVHGNNLNIFSEKSIASGLNISAGEHTIRIEATASRLKWHFFLDSFSFTAQ